jgi:hypothetical protein
VKRVTRVLAVIEAAVGLAIGLALNSRAVLVGKILAIVVTILVPRMGVLRRSGPDPDSLVVRTLRSRLPDDGKDPDA